MLIGLLIIGDEILSGKRADQHLPKVIEILKVRGLQLDWAFYIGDDPSRITAKLKQSFASNDIVFSCGGIGATPDDHTRQCVADALDVPLVLHPFAREAITQRIGKLAQEKQQAVDLNAPDNQNRLKMGEFPLGAGIVPNSFNNIPGFSIGTHYFVPGFPEMAWSMIEWALDTHHSHLFHSDSNAEMSIFVYDIMEAALTPLMEQIEADYSKVKTYSLPKLRSHTSPGYIEFGVKGDAFQVPLAFKRVLAWMNDRNAEYKQVDAASSK